MDKTTGKDMGYLAPFIIEGLRKHSDINFLRITDDVKEVKKYLRVVSLKQKPEESSSPVKLKHQPVRMTTQDGRYLLEISPERLIYPGQIMHRFMWDYWKRFVDYTRRDCGRFNADGLIRKLRDNQRLVKIVNSAENGGPSVFVSFGVIDLGELTRYTASNQPCFSADLPVLLVPGAEGDGDVLDFCSDNAVYRKWDVMPGESINQFNTRLGKIITKQEYLDFVSKPKEQYPIELCQC